jgi:hypothetical protein
MVVMIDLHAADIDELRTTFARLFETAQSVVQIGGEKRRPLEVEGEGLQRSPPPGFRHADRI